MPNFAKQIFDLNSSRPNKIALIDDKMSLTYKQLEKRAYNFSAYLKSKNLKPQSRIVFCFDDCVEWPVAFLGSLLAGLNPVCFHFNDSIENLKKLVETVNAESVIVNSIPDVDCNVQWILKADVLNANNSNSTEVYNYHGDEPCYWTKTSGTTGHGKIIVHRHDIFSNYYESTKTTYSIDSTSVIFATPKLSFGYGLHACVSMSLPAGATVVLMSGIPSPSKIVQLINQQKITDFYTVPTIVNSLLKHSKSAKMPSLKNVLAGGEPLPVSISREFNKTFGILVKNCIGMNEVGQIYCIQTDEDYEHGTLGKLIPGVECKLVNELGEIVADGDIGELYIKSNCSALMYWKDWEYTRKTFIGEWIKTGDKLKKTKLGNYVYVSRVGDQIKINGMFVTATEVESEIFKYTAVEDCAVVFVETDLFPKIHAFIKLVKNIELLDTLDLKKFLADKLPYFKVPSEFHVVDVIPKTLTNKTKRQDLRNFLIDNND